MKTLVLGIALAFASGSAQAAECVFDSNLTVNGAPTVAVSTGSGDVKVTTGDDTHVHIHGVVTASHGLFTGAGKAEKQVKAVCDKPPIDQNGNDIRVGKQDDDIYDHVAIDYTMELPRSSKLSADTGSGEIDIRDIEGAVKASTGSGEIKATNLGAEASLETGSGDIKAEGIKGAAKVETGSGEIEISGVAGALKAQTGSGSIEAEGTISANWKLETGSGDIKTRIPAGKGFDLDAATGSGSINVAEPVTMKGGVNQHHVNGTVGGGGPTLHVETGSGDIDLQ